MNPFFSIITPTIQRESLVACCESINSQTYSSWEHLVCFDGRSVDPEMEDRIAHQQRLLLLTPETRKWGNHQRWSSWPWARGSYLIYLDDDNTMYRPDALADIASYLAKDQNPDWALFPIHRHGSVFLLLPPGMCMTDTANMVIKRGNGRWPNIEAREADGVLAEELKANHAYSAFPDCSPIILMERSSNGQ